MALVLSAMAFRLSFVYCPDVIACKLPITCGSARTSKNSSKLEDTMHRYRKRSSTGTSGRCAQSSTRSLKAKMLRSRCKNSGGNFGEMVCEIGWAMA